MTLFIPKLRPVVCSSQIREYHPELSNNNLQIKPERLSSYIIHIVLELPGWFVTSFPVNLRQSRQRWIDKPVTPPIPHTDLYLYVKLWSLRRRADGIHISNEYRTKLWNLTNMCSSKSQPTRISTIDSVSSPKTSTRPPSSRGRRRIATNHSGRTHARSAGRDDERPTWDPVRVIEVADCCKRHHRKQCPLGRN